MDLINRESILEYRFIPEKGFEDDKFAKGWNSAINAIYATAKSVTYEPQESDNKEVE